MTKEEAIEWLTDIRDPDEKKFNEALDIGIKAIEALDRQKGEWQECEVSDEKAIEEWQSARCSVCGKYHTTPYMYCFDKYNFCPNCGAMMRGE